MPTRRLVPCLIALACITPCLRAAEPATLEKRLQNEDPTALVRAARGEGDAARGAILFYQRYMACTQCHKPGAGDGPLGPELARRDTERTDAHLVESVLFPSKVIRKGYEPVAVHTTRGKVVVGLLVRRGKDGVVLRDPQQNGKEVAFPAKEIEEVVAGTESIMPAGQVNQLASRQQFLDLLRYLIALRDGGPRAARELEPPPTLVAAPPLPEYENDLDHAGLIADLDDNAFRRGQAIYDRLCVNCHGTADKPGSLPTSLRFASGTFKNGSDPYTMYQTLTRGFGMMAPQTWMVPRQKYDVIHYIRKAYLEKHNPSQYTPIDKAYLAGLPKGTGRGPAPTSEEPWVTMDYGPTLINTYEVPGGQPNFAYKGIAVRLDPGQGGVSRGSAWAVFDHDTLRFAAAWTGKGFIDWNGIQFNGKHAVHPRLAGSVHVANPMLPGWGKPGTGTFDDPRLVGRDGRHYGPLPRPWAHYKGLYHHGNRAIIAYTVGKTEVLEMPGLVGTPEAPVFTRTFNVGPRDEDMILQVAHESGAGKLTTLHPGVVAFGTGAKAESGPARLTFDGTTSLAVAKPGDFDMRDHDYTVRARIRTREGGSIFSRTAPRGPWVPDGKTFFVRGGRLCFDIGWVGVVTSRRPVADGKWHDVAMTYEHTTGRVRLFIDGKPDAERALKPKGKVIGHAVRIGYTSPNFPGRSSFFKGDLAEVRFYRRALSAREVADTAGPGKEGLVARWVLAEGKAELVRDATGGGHDGKVVRGEAAVTPGVLVAGLHSPPAGVEWVGKKGDLRLKIPAGKEPLKFVLWMARTKDPKSLPSPDAPAIDLAPLTHGGPRRWLDVVKTQGTRGSDDGPFAVDVLTRPASNPWHCQVRLGGFDFFPDGKRAAVACWDGDVWLVSGVDVPGGVLTWQRIASGLFQPLGLKIVDGKIYITCRDQLVILHDLNGDGETDFYENFNNDHQVTEHFHEFAMGLQTDAEGNFYYAKSARHALPALVPHHGTLLKVSRDGSHTEILATGFRAANGVCVNPDGTFFVTDQEGHWTPKNRINWVRKGKFYGNMMGYHDVKDPSDDAMEPPVCWITNAFDRSPAEPLWVTSKAWGPLNGSLLNLSYGYGKVFVVPHEKVGDLMQGGMVALPVPPVPTGLIRGRFHPRDGQMYACGLFAWAGNQTQPGGFYRIRYTGKPPHVPMGLKARKGRLEITFTDPLDPKSVRDPENVLMKVWSLRRTKNYGSKHYNEHGLEVRGLRLSADGKTLTVEVPEVAPTWCMEIKYALRGADGEEVKGVIHNTIHALGE